MINIKQIKINIENEDNILMIKKKVCKILNINDNDIISLKIIKKSIDARIKNNIFFVYEVNIQVNDENKVIRKINNINVAIVQESKYELPDFGNEKINNITIVGSGPSGMFCAYMLLKKNFKVTIIEQGDSLEERIKKVDEFWNNNILDEDTNVQFGEGGAGTFSDGKLNTLIKDERHLGKFVFETFVECGANENILYENKPHIGTDVLRKVILNMRNKILNMGGTIRFNTKLTDIIINNKKLDSITVNNNEKIKTDLLVLALGNSARSTFKLLYDKKIDMTSKPFAVGLRVIHPRKLIDKAMYGEKYFESLGAASYKLTYQASNKKGVYSFCMCPGGYVVNASSFKEKLVVNGMSYSKRDSICSNSAIVVTVNSDDFGNGTLDGMYFQEELERKAYKYGNSFMPIQLYKDYRNNIVSNKFGSFVPEIKGKYSFANLNNIFPENINLSLKEAIDNFDKKIKGFANDDTILVGVETRTSSPVRIVRNEDFETSINKVYATGEGAGYAGGITSCAIDGIKCAEKIINKYYY